MLGYIRKAVRNVVLALGYLLKTGKLSRRADEVEIYERRRRGNKISEHMIASIMADIKETALTDSSRILDVGTGTGLYAERLTKNSYLVGLDISQDMAMVSRKKGIEMVVGNATHLPFRQDSFDTCIMVDVLHHLENPEVALQECSRVSSHQLVIVEPNYINLYAFLCQTFLNERILRERRVEDLLSKEGYSRTEKHYLFFLPSLLPDIFFKLSLMTNGMAPRFHRLALRIIYYAKKGSKKRH